MALEPSAIAQAISLLHFDHYCAPILLFLFNPIVTFLRGIPQVSELKKVQKKIGVPRASLGSLQLQGAALCRTGLGLSPRLRSDCR